jgi:outer membrane protein TolC
MRLKNNQVLVGSSRGRRLRWLAVALFTALSGSFGCQASRELQPSKARTLSATAEVVKPASLNDQEPIALVGVAEMPPEVGTTASVVPLAAKEHAIDLATALGLAGVENPTIALAREAIRASLAEQTEARVLLLPTLSAGMNFNLHRGNLQSSQGIIRDVDRQALYVGAGARAVGAGTVTIPGVRLTAHLADAVFAPVAARQQVIGSRFDALATQNRVLLEVATRYFALAGAEARLQAIRESEVELAEVVRLTANYARTGQGREGDAERSRSAALLLHVQEERAEEEDAVAAADLARLLNFDPADRLRVRDAMLPVVHLVDPHEDLEKLVQIALTNRPEIETRTAEIARVETLLRQEKVRPLVPLLSVGFSAGQFGGGSDQTDPSFGHFGGRTDFDAVAVWSLENLGLGNLAAVRRLRADLNQAAAERVRVVDQVRREVAEAQALSAARYLEMYLARQRIDTAQRAFRQDLARTKNLQGRPIEVLNSLDLLNAARQEFIRALIDYDQAQFALFVSLGQLLPRGDQDRCRAW